MAGLADGLTRYLTAVASGLSANNDSPLAAGLRSAGASASAGAYAKGLSDYMNATDDAVKQSALQQMASANPKETLAYQLAQEKMANDLEKQRIQRTFNTTNEIKNMEYLMGQGYTPEQARELAFKPKKDVAEQMLDREQAKQYAEDIDAIRSAEATYPQLEANVNRLMELSPKATFTPIGKGIDKTAKFFGKTTEGAEARAEFESIVNNAVLPLLKQTFGAAFTAEEGLRLQKTLADPDATDKEKIATLNTFIAQKKADIESKKRKLNSYSGKEELKKDNDPLGIR